jgi:hypothetical protein
MAEEVTHKEIYDRLCKVEEKVDTVHNDTKDIVSAFQAAQGAFTVLGWLATAAKPLLWIGALITAIAVAWESWKPK